MGWGTLALSGLWEPPLAIVSMSVPWPSAPSRTGGAVGCLAEALLWVGASVAVSPPWQLGPLGKGAALPGCEGLGQAYCSWARGPPSPTAPGARRVGATSGGVQGLPPSKETCNLLSLGSPSGGHGTPAAPQPAPLTAPPPPWGLEAKHQAGSGVGGWGSGSGRDWGQDPGWALRWL